MKLDANIQPLKRSFLAENFKITDWNTLEPYFKDLAERALTNREELDQWLKDTSELEAVVSEEACWRQINMTRDTTDTALAESFTFFMTEIQPKMQPYADQLNRKLIGNPLSAELTGPGYFTYLRNVKKNIELFREENILLQSELAVEAQQFGAIAGKMTVTVNDREYTLQQAAKFLENPDRALRESVYRKIGERRLQDKEALDDLFDTLLKKRHQVAINAGFENYRDYRFAELGRFDYSKENCFQFHEAVKEHVLPLVDQIYRQKKEKLGLEQLRPWDIDAEPEGTEPLRPFSTGSELVEKAIQCFNALNPFFGDCLRRMNEMGRLDLESRKGKAPGGYNCPLAETGAPFIFMNAAGTMDDVTTMVHEGGHAIHSFLTHPLPLSAFKEYPTEIAEVASMSMELFSMEHWTGFFKTPEELKRAHEQQLERVLTIFPWIATIDQFQHWIYEHPTHTRQERQAAWQRILASFTPPTLDTGGLEDYRNFSWQRQLHLYEVPFYYIEYGIAQLGAIGLWQQYKINKEEALDHYVQALSLGGTEPLPRLFEAAGLRFDLSPDHIKGLMEFVKKELDGLK
ncbi:M3 family oligoendopeptidase [Niabella hirudinis]|uniref:M3 family oligoendopeptidase n=1 Tax=Niabella hirudinis TaxID=1285929 RepID=UPI003EB93646